MAHTAKNKEKLLARIRRIKGQVNAIESGLKDEDECTDLLNLVASTRGALNGLMSELIEGHVMEHVLDHHKKPSREQILAAEQLLAVVKAYLK